MNEELNDLYQDVLLEHCKSSRRRYRPASSCSCVEAYNPLCGDEISFYIHKDHDAVATASYECKGCAISQATASIVAQSMEGRSVSEAREELHAALSWVRGDSELQPKHEDWGALGGVAKFPMRVKCATMPLRAALAALDAPEGVQLELGDEA